MHVLLEGNFRQRVIEDYGTIRNFYDAFDVTSSVERTGAGVATYRRQIYTGTNDAVNAVLGYLNRVYQEVLLTVVPGTAFGGENSAYMRDRLVAHWVRRHDAERTYRTKYDDRDAQH